MRVVCPIRGCDRSLAMRQLLCPDHWGLVPIELRRAVRDHKVEPDSEAYVQAVRAAIAHVASRSNEATS